MDIHKKLQYLLKKKGHGSQVKLSLLLDEDKTYLNKWVKGTKPVPRDMLLKTASFLGVSVEYLLDDKQEMPSNKHIYLIGDASCSVPTEYFHTEDTKYLVRSPKIHSHKTYAVRAIDNSMEDIIYEGNIVICDADKSSTDNIIAHYTYNGKSGIKRIKNQKDGSIMLVPQNPSSTHYDAITIPKERTSELQTAQCIQVMKSI